MKCIRIFSIFVFVKKITTINVKKIKIFIIQRIIQWPTIIWIYATSKWYYVINAINFIFIIEKMFA